MRRIGCVVTKTTATTTLRLDESIAQRMPVAGAEPAIHRCLVVYAFHTRVEDCTSLGGSSNQSVSVYSASANNRTSGKMRQTVTSHCLSQQDAQLLLTKCVMLLCIHWLCNTAIAQLA